MAGRVKAPFGSLYDPAGFYFALRLGELGFRHV
jgi:hypothetical protein